MAKNYVLKFIFFTALSGIGLSSCNLINPPETIPAYMKISSIHLDTVPGQGTNSNAINCAWVYIDDNPVGAFPLPCTFPIVASNGTHQLQVFAGIEENGTAATRTQYPFYKSFQENITLSANQTVTVNPKVSYTQSAHFHWMEDFESVSFRLYENKALSDTNMFTTTVGAFEGRSGEVVLTAAKPTYEGDSDTLLGLPKDGATPVYLEFNYKSDVAFVVGMYYSSIGNQLPILAVSSSSTWNKMYVNLQPTILTYSSAPPSIPFYVYFFVALPSGMDTAHFMLDNIKLVQ